MTFTHFITLATTGHSSVTTSMINNDPYRPSTLTSLSWWFFSAVSNRPILAYNCMGPYTHKSLPAYSEVSTRLHDASVSLETWFHVRTWSMARFTLLIFLNVSWSAAWNSHSLIALFTTTTSTVADLECSALKIMQKVCQNWHYMTVTFCNRTSATTALL